MTINISYWWIYIIKWLLTCSVILTLALPETTAYLSYLFYVCGAVPVADWYMASVLEETSITNIMETSNFAHVIFQNVGKSYVPHAALECHYTLTQFIRPHHKDWVGIFKVRSFSSSDQEEPSSPHVIIWT